MYGKQRTHVALVLASVFGSMTACTMEDPTLLERAADPAWFEEGTMDDQAALAPQTQESLAPSPASITIDDAHIKASAPVYVFAKHSGKVLDVAWGYTGNGAEVIQYDQYVGAKEQMFYINHVYGNYYRIVASHSGKVLTVSGGAYSDGTKIVQWGWYGGDNQLFHFEHLGAGEYKITAKHSGKVLEVSGASYANHADIVQWPWHGGDNQRWRLSPAFI